MTCKTFAPAPVWRGSKMSARFFPLASDRTESRKAAARLFHKARQFERQTRGHFKRDADTPPSRQDGAIGRTGLAVLHAMLFDHLNHRTGQLDPSYATIATAASCSIRSVARALQRLKAAGVLTWERQCEGAVIGGRWCLKQLSNAYAVMTAANWKGYADRPPAPSPEPGTWGDHPPTPSGLAGAADVVRAGGSASGRAFVDAAANDPLDPLGASIARLARLRSTDF